MEMNNYSSLFKEKQAMSSKDKLAKPLFKLNAILIVYTEQTLDCNEVPPPPPTQQQPHFLTHQDPGILLVFTGTSLKWSDAQAVWSISCLG